MEDVINDPIIIYRHVSDGGKNFENFVQLRGPLNYTYYELMTTPLMFCHDQEVLEVVDYDQAGIANKLICFPPSWSKELRDQFLQQFWSRLNVKFMLHFEFLNGYDKFLLCHSEKNSAEVEHYRNHGFVPVYIWTHALIARDWYRYAQFDPNLAVNLDLIDKDFLIYNRAWSGSREYRLKFTELVVQNDLHTVSRIKFAQNDNGLDYRDHVFKNPNLQITSTNLHEILETNTASAALSAEVDFVDYTHSGIEVVLETLFDATKNHLTEKSLRPISTGRPFILVSTPGSLQYLRDYGFKTFAGLIDETYDTIQDPLQRLQAIAAEMKRIRDLDPEEKRDLYTRLYAIADENRTLFFSDSWGQGIMNEFLTNFAAAYQEVVTGSKGSHINHLISEWLNQYPDFANLYYNRPHRTKEEWDQFVAWCNQP